MQPYKYDPRDLNINTFTTKDKLRHGQAQGQSSSLLSATTLKASSTQQLVGDTQASALLDNGALPCCREVRTWQNQDTEVNPSRQPVFLTPAGKWHSSKLPGLLTESKAQPLTAPGAYTPAGTLKHSLTVAGPKAVAAIHTYHDVSPAVHTECAHDVVSWAPHTSQAWDTTVPKRGTARLHDGHNVAANPDAMGQTMMLTSRGRQPNLSSHRPVTAPTVDSLTWSREQQDLAVTRTVAPGLQAVDDVRHTSISSFWARARGGDGGRGSNQQIQGRDLNRSQDNLAKHSVAGGHNAALIGGTWRCLERPLVGTPLFTDYYGRFDTQTGNYYGRSWHHVPQ